MLRLRALITFSVYGKTRSEQRANQLENTNVNGYTDSVVAAVFSVFVGVALTALLHSP